MAPAARKLSGARAFDDKKKSRPWSRCMGKLVDRCSPICPSIADQADRSQNGGAMAAASTAVETTLGQRQARRPPARLEPAETLQRPGLRFVSRRMATGPPRRARSPPPEPRTRPNRPCAGRIARDRFRATTAAGSAPVVQRATLVAGPAIPATLRTATQRRPHRPRCVGATFAPPALDGRYRTPIAHVRTESLRLILRGLVCHGSGPRHLRGNGDLRTVAICGTAAIAPPDVCGADDSTVGWPAATGC